MTVLQLATAVDSDVGNISRLERDTQGYSQKIIEKIAQALDVPVVALFSDDQSPQCIAHQGKVPILSLVAAGNWNQARESSPGDEPEEWTPCPVRHGPRTYALRVTGESMHNPMGKPSFQDGDIIFVDPDLPVMNKSLVIVRLDDENKTLFKRLLLDDYKQFLEALNPAWPERIIKVEGQATICGVVFAKIESFV